MQNYFVRPLSSHDAEVSVNGTSELDAACRYLLDHPVRSDLAVRPFGGTTITVTLAEVTKAFPDMEKLLAAVPAAAPAAPTNPAPVAGPAPSVAAPIHPESAEDAGEDYSKIGGWLWVLAIALVVGAIMFFTDFVEARGAMEKIDMKQLEQLRPDLARFVRFALAADIVLGVMALASSALLFTKKKFARFFILFFLALSAAHIVTYLSWSYNLGLELAGDEVAQSVKSGVICCIWLGYMAFSRRARLTFVR